MKTVLRRLAIVTLSICFWVVLFSVVGNNSVHAVNSVTCTQADIDKASVCDQVKTSDLGFNIPSLADILTFIIRGFFVIAGLAALLFMLLGAFAWVTSSGEKDAVAKAQQKIQAAVVGVIMIIVVLSVIWTLENIVFNKRICVGLTCPVTIPGLLTSNNGAYCCKCATASAGAPLSARAGDVIDVFAGATCDVAAKNVTAAGSNP